MSICAHRALAKSRVMSGKDCRGGFERVESFGRAMRSQADGHFQVKSSQINGHGLFAEAALPGRRKIGELTGEVVKVARRVVGTRAKIYYLELSSRYALDCTNGNDFKYLNHSCRPNCYLRIVRRTVEVYTLRPVPAGSELTIDYGETPHKGGMRCGCGAAGCRTKL